MKIQHLQDNQKRSPASENLYELYQKRDKITRYQLVGNDYQSARSPPVKSALLILRIFPRSGNAESSKESPRA
jgi:hypothetical protein